MAEVHQKLRLARDRRDDSRTQRQGAGRRDAAVAAADLLDAQCHRCGCEPRVPAAVHRRRARVGSLATEQEAVPLDPRAAADGGSPQALVLQHRALLDVKLEVRAHPLLARGRLRHPLEIHAVLGEGIRDADSVRIAEVAYRRRLERSREGGAPEEAAAESCALLVGPVDELERPGRRLAGP